MNELTKREQIALAVLQGDFNIISSAGMAKVQDALIIEALDFADLFLSISEDMAGKTVSEIEKCPICKGSGDLITHGLCFNCSGTGKIAVYGKPDSEMENVEARR